MFTSNDQRTLWQRRAAYVQFMVWQGRKVLEMTDIEIQAAFAGLAREYGISYIWRNSLIQ